MLTKYLIAGSKRLSRKRLNLFLEQHAAAIAPGCRVLNVGSGGQVGEIIAAAGKASDFSIISIDIDPGREPDVVDDICRSRFADGAFDVIVMSEVLEHVTHPHDAADEICRLLSPGGTLILTVPFMFPIHDRPHDYFRYTEYGLRYLFSGLAVQTFERRDTWAEALLMIATRIVRERGKRPKIAAAVIVPAALMLAPLAALIGRVVATDFMTSGYMLKAVKPL